MARRSPSDSHSDTVAPTWLDLLASLANGRYQILVECISEALPFVATLYHFSTPSSKRSALSLLQHSTHKTDVHHLRIIRSSLNIFTPLDATIGAAACSALYGLMRVGEFTTCDGIPFGSSWQARRRDFLRGWDSTAMRPFWSLRLPAPKRRPRQRLSEVLRRLRLPVLCTGQHVSYLSRPYR